jgi:hypothetical protein
MGAGSESRATHALSERASKALLAHPDDGPVDLLIGAMVAYLAFDRRDQHLSVSILAVKRESTRTGVGQGRGTTAPWGVERATLVACTMPNPSEDESVLAQPPSRWDW